MIQVTAHSVTDVVFEQDVDLGRAIGTRINIHTESGVLSLALFSRTAEKSVTAMVREAVNDSV